VASIRKVTRARARSGYAWEVRYRDPDRRDRSRTFERKADAESFANKVESDIDRDSYIDPNKGKVTLDAWAEQWFATTRHLKPKTREGYESLLRKHVLPRLGRRPLARIAPIDVRTVISELIDSGLSPSRVRQARHIMGMLFAAAVADRAIASSPVTGVKVPRERRREMQILTAEQVSMLANAVDDRYRALVYLLAYGGLRWGEAAALRRGKVNLLRARIEVSESVTETGRGGLQYGPTKTHQARGVALPAFLVELLEDHLDRYVDDGRDALVFTTESGTPLRNNNFRRRVWAPALVELGFPHVRIHDLRHTCATLLIAQGAHAKAIQRHLGHSTIQITFDTYGHLLPDEQDRVAAALDETFRSANGADRRI
jgi:integrase